MLKLLARWIGRIASTVDIDRVDADPLQHPAIERMSERELADLPLGPEPRTTCCIA
jgi:hypothetical protein